VPKIEQALRKLVESGLAAELLAPDVEGDEEGHDR
jgi:hypothetical protein